MEELVVFVRLNLVVRVARLALVAKSRHFSFFVFEISFAQNDDFHAIDGGCK